jgi:hypothetical protein
VLVIANAGSGDVLNSGLAFSNAEIVPWSSGAKRRALLLIADHMPAAVTPAAAAFGVTYEQLRFRRGRTGPATCSRGRAAPARPPPPRGDSLGK